MTILLPFPGSKVFIVNLPYPKRLRAGNNRIEIGPFGCWNLYLGRIRIAWELKRWH